MNPELGPTVSAFGHYAPWLAEREPLGRRSGSGDCLLGFLVTPMETSSEGGRVRKWDPRLHVPGLSLTGVPGSGNDALGTILDSSSDSLLPVPLQDLLDLA